MGRFCYCSRVLPGKSDLVREHWRNKPSKSPQDEVEETEFWYPLKMTGFESWLQPNPQGDMLIHCLEGDSLPIIFRGLRMQIASGNRIALKLQQFYQQALGKDYGLPDVEPYIEQLMDISLSTANVVKAKRGFCYPLLPHKKEEHRQFRLEAMGAKRWRHEASMRSFGISRLSCWLQETANGAFVIVYTEGEALNQMRQPTVNSPEWKEISETLSSHSGLPISAFSPEVEWLTASKK